MNRDTFETHHPGVFFLDASDLSATTSYLKTQGWLHSSETLLEQEKAGEGNMNCTLRLRTSERTIIFKQARPWVEKYPQIPAPWDRALHEARFYQLTGSNNALAPRMPRLLGIDPQARTLLLEDLGQGNDFLSLYQNNQTLDIDSLNILTDYLIHLHSASFDVSVRESLTNREMRALNHEHMFALPIRHNNGVDLEAFFPGLTQAAQPLLQNKAYKQRVAELGTAYLADGTVLLHGDYYPGSWLQRDQDIFILDPEFGFFGTAAFDVGVCLGHILLANQPQSHAHHLLQRYQTNLSLDLETTLGYAGIEIMRRLLGVAQLPLDADLARRVELLQLSEQLVLRPSATFRNKQ